MLKLKNPIPAFIRDSSRLQNFYKEYNLVPYAGSSTATGHSFLKLLSDLFELSPSHGTCIEDKRFWAFSGDLSVIRKGRSGLKPVEEEQDPLPANEQEAFVDDFEGLGLRLADIGKIVSLGELHEAKTGNSFIRYREIEVGGTRRVEIRVLDPMDVMYLNTEPGEPRTVVISKDFFAGVFNIKQTPPELVRVFPDFSEGANYRETVFHWKNQRDGSDWYGRPSTLHTLYWQYVEWKKSETEAKISGTETTAKIIFGAMKPNPLALKGDGEDPELEFQKWAAGLRKIVTAKGEIEDAEGIGFIGYPYEGQAPTMYKIDVNRDWRYFDTTTSLASDYIYAAHSWSKVMTGFKQASANIGGNVMKDEFLFRDARTIQPLQRKWSNRIKEILFLMGEFSGSDRLGAYGIEFENKVTNLIENLSDANATNKEGSPDPVLDGPGDPDLQPD